MMKLLLIAFLAIWPAFAQYATQYQGQQPGYGQQQYPQFSQYRTSTMNDGYGSNSAYGQPAYNSPYGRNSYNSYSSTPYSQYGYSSSYDPNRGYSSSYDQNRGYSSVYDTNRLYDANGYYNGVSVTTTVAALVTTALAFFL
ncbi:hypothetical protein KIN20_023027 [Parelaphostrongylus tenuis]|uniref:Uncharacterized protein n=1 Tax=Parelaphostrongylus tenuis TaxID=148309 RepID=A0AAD5MRC1_PARTN|nr:hypothetical protein KIN20_023027 [Parelaphostrongylus tenuis]